MIITVASGKGGTGKTTVAVNLARTAGKDVDLLDCDVEAPNDHLFLKVSEVAEEIFGVPIPEVNTSLCDACGECSQFCQFNAIVTLKTGALVFPELCHSCGGCVEICPKKALSEVNQRSGVIRTSTDGSIRLTQGLIDVGISTVPPLIKAVKTRRRRDVLTIIDAPPGTSCPVITAVEDADFVLLVTEPTPFGLNDLKLAVEMVRALKLKYGVVINRVGVGDERVHEYCRQEGISILLEIPDDRRIAEAYSRGELMVDALPEYRGLFLSLLAKVGGAQ